MLLTVPQSHDGACVAVDLPVRAALRLPRQDRARYSGYDARCGTEIDRRIHAAAEVWHAHAVSRQSATYSDSAEVASGLATRR